MQTPLYEHYVTFRHVLTVRGPSQGVQLIYFSSKVITVIHLRTAILGLKHIGVIYNVNKAVFLYS